MSGFANFILQFYSLMLDFANLILLNEFYYCLLYGLRHVCIQIIDLLTVYALQHSLIDLLNIAVNGEICSFRLRKEILTSLSNVYIWLKCKTKKAIIFKLFKKEESEIFNNYFDKNPDYNRPIRISQKKNNNNKKKV